MTYGENLIYTCDMCLNVKCVECDIFSSLCPCNNITCQKCMIKLLKQNDVEITQDDDGYSDYVCKNCDECMPLFEIDMCCRCFDVNKLSCCNCDSIDSQTKND